MEEGVEGGDSEEDNTGEWGPRGREKILQYLHTYFLNPPRRSSGGSAPQKIRIKD